MSKRRLLFTHAEQPPLKRERLSNGADVFSLEDHHAKIGLLHLSNELLLRIASYLSVHELNDLQRVCRQISGVAVDRQIWKAHFYERFVYSPTTQPADVLTDFHDVSSTVKRWLDEGVLSRDGAGVDWKRQYKIRHKWTTGICQVREIEVGEQPAVPPSLVSLHGGIVYTLDTIGGLRAYSSKKGHQLLGKLTLKNSAMHDAPTCLSVDPSLDSDKHQVAIGLENGELLIYNFCLIKGEFQEVYRGLVSPQSMPVAVAYYYPYLLTLNAAQALSVFRFLSRPNGPESEEPQKVLQNVSSSLVSPPYYLSIRPSSEGIIATIAFSIRGPGTGCLVGIQELCLSDSGTLLSSRYASSTNSSHSFASPLSSSLPASRSASPFSTSPGHNRPTSISYTHPHLLVSHADNTLSSYLVSSNDAAKLSIGPPTRLWGHTSAVSAAHVGPRGKAVSVTMRGDDLRIWELAAQPADASVRIQPNPKRPAPRPPAADSFVRGWLGFDEENVVILRESPAGSQALVVYDFS